MAIAPETLKKLIEEAIASGDGRFIIIDGSGNIVSDIPLSEIHNDLVSLKNALKSVGTDKVLIDISEDDVGLAKDATLVTVENNLLSIKTQRYLGVHDLTIDSGEILDIPSGKEASFKSLTLNGKLYIHGTCRLYSNLVYIGEGIRLNVCEGGLLEVVGNA